MIIRAIKCPACNADLPYNGTQKIMFCSYCGQRILFDDEVKKSEHIYRKIDEARLREAEARLKEAEIIEKRESAKVRNKAIKYIVAGVLVVALIIIPFYSRAALMKGVSNQDKKDEQLENTVSSQLIPICRDNQATITYINVFGNSVRIHVTATDSSKETADKLQEDIISNLTLGDGIEISVDLEYPQYKTLRSFEIDKYGQVQISNDYANTIPEEDIKTLTKDYKDALAPIINNYRGELESIQYKGDEMVLEIITPILEKAKIDQFINDLITTNNTLNSLPLRVYFKTSSVDFTCEVEISSDNTITIEDDRRNEMSDEDAEAIIQDFLPALSKASKKHDAKISEITVEEDTLNVNIAAEYEDKSSIEKLEQSINGIFEKKNSINAVIRITTDNKYDTTKVWSIDTNGIIDVMYDFTK